MLHLLKMNICPYIKILVALYNTVHDQGCNRLKWNLHVDKLE